jgi:catechol 2,3-dioxygenase-like lactoylglutathione lyase family enzyme
MIDHVSHGVVDLERSKAFYDAALGVKRIMDFAEAGYAASGYGAGQEPQFWIGAGSASERPQPSEGAHLAFAAPSRAAVDAFHAAAMRAGARDNGRPGLRPHYHPNYYAALVIDPDGHHLEAVCHAPA